MISNLKPLFSCLVSGSVSVLLVEERSSFFFFLFFENVLYLSAHFGERAELPSQATLNPVSLLFSLREKAGRLLKAQVEEKICTYKTYTW